MQTVFPERITNLKYRFLTATLVQIEGLCSGSFMFPEKKAGESKQLKRCNFIINESKTNVETSSAVSAPVHNGEDWILLKKVKGKQDKNNGYSGEKKGSCRSSHPM